MVAHKGPAFPQERRSRNSSPQAPHPSPNALFQRDTGQAASIFQRLCIFYIFYLFEINRNISVNRLWSIFSLKCFAFQTIRPVASRKKRSFSARFGPGGAVPPPRDFSSSKAKRPRVPQGPRQERTDRRRPSARERCAAGAPFPQRPRRPPRTAGRARTAARERCAPSRASPPAAAPA